MFSREFGKLRALAKGGRRPKGPFEAALDLLATSRIVFLRKSSDALDLLTEAKLVRRFRPHGRDLASLYAGYYLAELLREMTQDGDPHPELFDLSDRTLAELAAGGPVLELVTQFELKMLAIVGHLPALRGCGECGRPRPAQGRMAFGLLDGGLLCSKCRQGKRRVITVAAPTLERMSQFADRHTWSIDPIAKPLRGELRGVLMNYLTHLVGRKLRMHQYVGTFTN